MRSLIILALTGLLAGAAFYAGGGWQRERALKNEINTTEEIRDAQNACPDDMPWFDRLRCINAQ